MLEELRKGETSKHLKFSSGEDMMDYGGKEDMIANRIEWKRQNS